MYLVIIILPLLGSIVSGFFGRKVGVSGAQFITCFSVIVTTILAVIAFFEVGFNNIPVSIELFRWIDSEWINIMVGFVFDSLTVYCVDVSLIWYINAVLVEIQLYTVIFVNRFFIGSGYLIPAEQINGNSTGMAHSNNKCQNRYLVKYFLQKRYFLSVTGSATGITQPLKGECCLKIAEEVDWENLLQWFVGFSDAEANFIINPILKKDKVKISSFSFMFKIALHQDDTYVLEYIHRRLAIGYVRFYKTECIFNVTDREGIKFLISIFDKYNLNTTKYLDYLDFKEAFNLYINKDKDLYARSIKGAIIELKNKMNTNRVNFDRPESSKILITKWWLLGFVEGDGSFFMRRDTFTPVFCIEITGVQLDVLIKIKEFLEKSLGFNLYSLYKLKHSSIIAVTTVKARKNSKSSVSLIIKNVRVLNNCFVPFLDDMPFLTKKGKDFKDFKIICKVVHKGAHKNGEIEKIILKLSYTMNNYRLSTNTALGSPLSKDEWGKLFSAIPTVKYLFDGRVRDITTGKIIHQQISCVYEILEQDGEILIANTLSEAATIIGVYPDTLSKYLDIEIQDLEEHWVTLNNRKIRRVPVF